MADPKMLGSDGGSVNKDTAAQQFEKGWTPKLEEFIEKQLKLADSGEHVLLAWELVLEALFQAGLAWHARIVCGFVGIHWKNRSTHVLDATNMMQHGADVLRQGFSLRKCSDVTCFECDYEDGKQKKSNDEQVELARGLLPALQRLKYVSVGGANTNGFLRACAARCKTPVPELQDADGNLDTERFCKKDPNFASALSDGMNWTVIDKTVEQKFPRLADLGQVFLIFLIYLL